MHQSAGGNGRRWWGHRTEIEVELGPAQGCVAKAVEHLKSLVPALVLMVSSTDKQQAAAQLGQD